MVSLPRSVRRFKRLRALRALIAAISLSLLFAHTVYAQVENLLPDKFGKVPVGNDSLSIMDNFCINGLSPGQSDKVVSVSIQGADATDFDTISEGCTGFTFNQPQSNCQNETCPIVHAFDPIIPGSLTGVVQVVDSFGITYQWNLQGTGGIIVTPSANQQFPLASPTPGAGAPGSASVTFTASNVTGTVNWKATTNYETSGGIKATTPPPVTFVTTTPNQSVTQLFTSQGGTMEVTATAEGYTDTVTAYITGSQIANADITQVTTNMYCPTNCCSQGTCTTENGGQPATKNLFTMIAFTESTCRQFVLNADKRYPLNPGALWPDENTKSPPPLGSRIGLGMVQLANIYKGEMETAWNWLSSAAVSLDFFNEKITDYALKVQSAQMASHTGLLPLNQTQLEYMALGE